MKIFPVSFHDIKITFISTNKGIKINIGKEREKTFNFSTLQLNPGYLTIYIHTPV